eukprot:COSAG01_NODE_13163_length_1626_cov_1.466929_3_plen_63_part_00
MPGRRVTDGAELHTLLQELGRATLLAPPREYAVRFDFEAAAERRCEECQLRVSLRVSVESVS